MGKIKNILFVMYDQLRADYLGCTGHPTLKTPHIDAFAQRAAILDQAYIASYPTVPNRWDMLTGRFGFATRGWQPLSHEDITVAQVLARRGVHTQMIWDTPMLAMHDYNYTRGFKGIEFVHGQKGDPWITDPSLPIRHTCQPHKIKNVGSMENYLRNHYGRLYERQYPVARTMSAAMDWLETNHRQDSFFLYVDMWDPHEPFDCPWHDYARYADPDYAGDQITYPQYGRPTYMTPEEHQNVRDLYAGQATLVDRWVGRFLDLAERLGLFDDTMIIWTTDHGHLFGEHDLQGKPGAELGKLYEITTRIPLLVHHPDGIGAGQHLGGIVQPPDLFATVLDFLGAPVPRDSPSRSILPLMSGDAGGGRAYAFSSRFPAKSGEFSYDAVEGAAFDGWVGSDRIVEPSTITDGEWAYLCAPQGLPSELYHIAQDPGQARNVIGDHPDVVARMHDAWVDCLRSHGAPESRVRPFVEGAKVDARAELGANVYAFRDDLGQWIAFPTEAGARSAAHRENAPGPSRDVRAMAYGDLLADNPKNLVYLFGQYYWAEELA